MKVIVCILFRMASESEAAKSEAQTGHNSRAASNNDIVFIPPRTPVRSKTRETQYNTPMKGIVSKSGLEMIEYLVDKINRIKILFVCNFLLSERLNEN
jgi:hypothetical protein